jgi:hypothetical protein
MRRIALKYPAQKAQNIPAQKEHPKKDFSHLNLLKRKGSYHREIAPDVK